MIRLICCLLTAALDGIDVCELENVDLIDL